MSNVTPLLELTHLSRFFQSGDTPIRALDDISLTIWSGEFVAIMGQSGSGKSTLMNLMGCLDKPSEGSYKIRGKEVAELQPDELATLRRETFGFVFQRYNLLATVTAEENVEIPAIYAGVSKPDRLERARLLLSQLGLGNRCDHKPPQLSGGQQQRVSIARALMNNPPIILADEPTGALDSKSGAEVMTLLKQLHQEGRTIILITHDEKVAAHAERVVHIFDGKITKIDETQKQTKQPLPESHSLKKKGISGFLPEIVEAVEMGMRALKTNWFRTSLTLLGIIIGVASVVIMLAVGNGSKQKVLDQITAMGTNLLSVRPGAPGLRGGGDVITLTPADAQAILSVPNVESVVPERNGRFTLRFGNTDYASGVQAMGADLPDVRDWPVERGTFYTEQDIQSYAPVAVLGQTVVKNLFPEGVDPIGQYILVRNVPFEIIGILSAKGASGWGGDQDDAVFIPLTTGIVRLFGLNYLNAITVKVTDLTQIEKTQNAITELLKTRHRTEDFSLRNMASILDAATETQNTLTILLGAVAAISLLVGGIGVMNIMLVSVTERTREIGIRMATGAKMRDILLQFNTEAAVVCVAGGVLGIMIGFIAGGVLNLLGVAVIFSVTPSLLAFSCAFFTGVLFGYLPARKAALLDPVVALASE